MVRILLTVSWLVLSAWLAIWAFEGLFGVNQRESILPFGGEDTLAPPIIIGVAWGLILTIGGALAGLGIGRKLHGETELGVGRIVEFAPTGLTVNDVPQYDLFLRVTPRAAEDFIAQLRMLVDQSDLGILKVDLPLPVHYSLTDQNTVQLADPTDPAVVDAMLAWRIERGLIDPSQVPARTTGTAAPASVLEVRETDRQKDGQSELALRVQVQPEGMALWDAETTAFVFPEALSRFQVGAPIWAFYRPEDPQTVAVTLERGIAR